MTCQVFLIAWLFPDKHNLTRGRPFAKDGLGGVFVEITAGTAGGGFL